MVREGEKSSISSKYSIILYKHSILNNKSTKLSNIVVNMKLIQIEIIVRENNNNLLK